MLRGLIYAIFVKPEKSDDHILQKTPDDAGDNRSFWLPNCLLVGQILFCFHYIMEKMVKNRSLSLFDIGNSPYIGRVTENGIYIKLLKSSILARYYMVKILSAAAGYCAAA